VRALALAIAAALAGCPGPEPARPPPPPPPERSSRAPAEAQPAADEAAKQEERLAAIQKAMNELDEAAQGCWAVAAVERFDIEGDIAAIVEIEATKAKATLSRDTTRNRKLASCLVALLERYPWAPPLYGQAIQLPFKFRAPNGQNVIDRNLVPWAGQGKIAIAVLLDENNSANGAASVIEIAIQAGGSTGARIAERAELWYFLGDGTVEVTAGGNRRAVKAGDMMYVPAGAARNVSATADMHAMIAIVPGGPEGSARMGALPTKELGAPGMADKGRPVNAGIVGPMYLPASAAKPFNLPNRGIATIFAEPTTIKDKLLAATILEMPGSAKVPEHVHAGETELLYVLAGSGTLTVNGVELAVTPTSTIQIPPKTKHAFTASADFRAVQIYTPAGPEQRFKAKP
jgi:quercetin dioxygenase-like cupin family protein